MRYLLDTNICLFLMHRRPPEIIERFKRLTRGEVVMSTVTLAELRVGLERRPELKDAAERALQLVLSHIPAVPFDTDASVSYGVLAAAVRDRRRDVLDRLIAAHAVSLGLTLVTSNEANFKDYPGLTVENWVSAAQE